MACHWRSSSSENRTASLEPVSFPLRNAAPAIKSVIVLMDGYRYTRSRGMLSVIAWFRRPDESRPRAMATLMDSAQRLRERVH